MKRYAPHALLAMVGALLVLLSLTVDPNSVLARSDVREIARIFGSVLFGLGISGTIGNMAAVRSEKRIETLIATFEGIVATQLREDLIPKLGISEHCIPVDDRLRGHVTLFHRSVSRDGKEAKWMRRDPTFSGPRDAHCLFAVDSLASPDGTTEQSYSFELTKRRNRLVITTLNLTDASEHAAMFMFDQMSLRDVTCGIVFHMDWAGQQRFSRAILTTNTTDRTPEELDAIWEEDFATRYIMNVGPGRPVESP